MEIVPFRTPGLGDQTFLLIHAGQGILVDPQRDVGRFLGLAAERDIEMRFVLETHLHNDYVSGGEQAALMTGAELVMPAAAAAAYSHTPAFHMEDIEAGDLTVRPIHTPGHTPEHTSYLVLLDGEPVALFSGGSLLVGSAGRVDLLGTARARTLSKLQHGSLHRLAGLPRGVGLYPTHGEGSFCTATGAGRPTSTIGQELDENPMLGIDDDRFADHMLAAPMPIPAFYQYMGPVNTHGPPPMPSVAVPELGSADLEEQPDGTRVVDIRPRPLMAAGFVPGSTGIELTDDFGMWAGWMLPHEASLVLVAERGQDVEEAVTQLAQVGVDDVRGVIRELSDVPVDTFEMVDVVTFVERMSDSATQVLDVRMPSEWATARLGDAVERFLPDLVTEGIPAELDRGRPVLVACGSGRRAAIAGSLLARQGYEPVVLDGAGVAEVIARASRFRMDSRAGSTSTSSA